MSDSRWIGLLVYGSVAMVACGDDGAAVPVPPAQPLCEATSQQSCFSGPADRVDVGLCHAGTQTCRDDGLAWGSCENEVVPAREICGDDVDDDCDGSVSCGETVWARLYGVDRDEYAMRVKVADGAIYLAGGYRDGFDFGGMLPAANSSRDVFVAKLSAEGEPAWSVGVSGTSNSIGRDVAVAPDGRVALVASVAGGIDIEGGPSFTSAGGNDVLVALFDADGNHLFSQIYGDADEQHPMAVAFDPAGHLVVSGFFRGAIDFGNGPLISGDYDGFLAVLEDDGTVVSAHAFGGKGDDLPRSMAIDAAGAIYLAGSFAGDIDFGQGMVSSQGDSDVFVVAFDPPIADQPLGLRWGRTFGDASAQTAWGVAVDAAGQVAVTGRFAGTLSLGSDSLEAVAGGVFTSLLDASGEPLWLRGLQGASNSGGFDVAFDSKDRVVVGGFYEGAAALDSSVLPESGLREQYILIVKYEPDGTSVWGRGIRVSGDQSIFSLERGWRTLALTSNDHIVLAGFVELGVEMTPGDMLTPQGGSDLLVGELLP